MGDPLKREWTRSDGRDVALVIFAIAVICGVASMLDGYDRLSQFINLPDLDQIGGLILGLIICWPLTVWFAWRMASKHKAEHALSSTPDQRLSGFNDPPLTTSLNDDENRVKAVIEHAEVGITIATTRGEYLTVNPKFCKFLGRDESEIIGKSYLDFAHPDEIAEMEAGRGQIVSLEKSTPTLERRYIRKDGEVVWGSMTPAPVIGQDGKVAYFVTVIVDVTDLRRSDRLLKQSEARLQQIIDVTGAGVWEVDVETARVNCDSRFKEISGYGDAFPGTIQAWDQLVHPDDRAVYFDRLLPDGFGPTEVEHTYRIRPVNGGERWVRMQGQLEYGEAGRPVRGLGLIWDVTEEIEAADQRQALEARLEEAQKLEMLGKLTGGVAHNFNNLMTIMMGSLQLLPLTKDDPVETAKGIDRALSAGKRASGLTKKLLAFSSNQSLMPDFDDLRVTLSELEPSLRESVSPEVDINLEVPASEIQCHVDHEQLKVVVNSVVTNAHDALPTGGRIEVRLSEVVFDRHGTSPPQDLAYGRYARIEVMDNGKGMSPVTLERAFEPFYTTKDFGAGSGLGLSMAYGFIQQSGGAIDLASQLGEGTTVTLFVPTVSAKPETGKVAATATATCKILLLEDDTEVRQSVRDYLSAEGCRVEEAADAASALSILKNDPAFDVLFADIVLPGSMNGIDLAHRVHDLMPDLKIVLTTGFIDSQLMGGLSIPDYATLIEKPYDFEDLAAQLFGTLSCCQPDS